MKNKTHINEDIYFVDNFLPEDFLDDLVDKVLLDSWHKHYSKHTDGIFFWALNLTDDSYGEELEYITSLFPDNDVLRVYVNGHSGIQHGSFHTDDGEETYLVGLTKGWNSESGGATEFKTKYDNSTISVYPLYNRLVCFPADIEHRASPNIDLYSFRMTMAIKTNPIKKNSGLNFL
jgi:hypothetical protein